MSRTHRLFQLMTALRRSAGPVTAASLAAETGVSERTLYRDIDTLRGLGAVIDGEAGFGYTLIEDAHLPPLQFDDEELEALVLGLREVTQIGDPALAEAARTALTKLRARLPERSAHRLEYAVLSARRFVPPPAPGIDSSALRKACWDEAQIRFDYTDKSGAQTTREVKPLQISFFENSHCLMAWCVLRSDFRAFRLDRMSAMERTGTSFRPERIPLLRAYLDQIRAASFRKDQS
ncbi:helix-turn-helix transcriptional regulator [Tropicibacter naphthalenivorans]|uniref:HTH domain protein n=1 Tax=Tropicibacter naphthalenivorans TaxID=441103 RepID=A0A0P1GEE7_9RHOB|nr:YafY family protein [Tropicibacter naphthalenivorans]CUH74728.1 HTH domain protein [Tropicibacter naphthalenivorans]SMC49511.1 HTH domain-containing protein [Tropicibacter naphthalenivorans]